MNNIRLLTINYFRSYIGSFSKKRSKGKYSVGALILLFVSFAFIMLFATMATSTMESALALDPPMPELSLYVTVGMILMFIMLMTVSRSTSPHKHNDEEMLLALPVKKSEIVTSKLLFNYLFDLFLNVGTLVPSLAVYFIYVPSAQNLGFVLRSGIILLLIPMLSNAIGSLLALFFRKISNKFKHYATFQSIFMVLFLVLFLIGYYALQYYISAILPTNPDFSMEDIAVLKYLVDFILGQNSYLLYGLIICLICIIPFIICIVLNALNLGKNRSGYRSKSKILKYEAKSVGKTLLKNELGRYFNSSVYVTNTLFGAVILIILSLVYLIIGPEYIISKLDLYMKLDVKYVYIIILAMAILIFSTVAISASSISIEGKNLWILKAHPISWKQIANHKALASFIVSSSCIIISSIFFGSRFIIDNGLLGIAYWLFYLITILLYALIIAYADLLINLIFPKMQWDNEMIVVKQSMAVGISLIANVVIGAVLFVPYAFCYKISPIIYLVVIDIIQICIFILLYIIILKKGQKMFEKIN